MDELDDYIKKSKSEIAPSLGKVKAAQKRAKELGQDVSDDVVADFYDATMLESGRAHYNKNGTVKESPRDPKDGQVAVGFSQIKPGTIKKWGNLDPYNENDNITGGLLEFNSIDKADPIARRIGYFAGGASSALKQYRATGKIPQGGDFTGTSFQKYIEKSNGFKAVDDYIRTAKNGGEQPVDAPSTPAPAVNEIDSYIQSSIQDLRRPPTNPVNTVPQRSTAPVDDQKDVNTLYNEFLGGRADSQAERNAFNQRQQTNYTAEKNAVNVLNNSQDLADVGTAVKEGVSYADQEKEQAKLQARLAEARKANPSLTVEQFNKTLNDEQTAKVEKRKQEYLSKHPAFAKFATDKKLDPFADTTIKAYNDQLPKGGAKAVAAKTQAQQTQAFDSKAFDEANAYLESQGQPKLTPEQFNATQQATSKVSISTDPNDFAIDGKKITDYELEMPAQGGGTIQFPREVGKGRDVDGVVAKYRSEKGMTEEQAFQAAMLNAGGRYGITPEMVNAHIAKVKAAGKPLFQGGKHTIGNTIAITWDDLADAGVDVNRERRMEQSQNTVQSAVDLGGPQYVTTPSGRQVEVANKDTPLPTFGEFVEQIAGERDANNYLTDERKQEVDYRTQETVDDKAVNELAGNVLRAAIDNNVSPQNAEAIAGFATTATSYLSWLGAGLSDINDQADPKRIMPGSLLVDAIYGQKAGNVLGRFGNRVQKVNELSDPGDSPNKVYRIVGNTAGALPAYVAVGAAVGGNPVLTFAITDALTTKGKGGGVVETFKAGAKGAVMGAMIGNLNRFGTMAADGLFGESLLKVVPKVEWEKAVDPVVRRAISRIWQAEAIVQSGGAEAASAKKVIERELAKSGLTLEQVLAAKPGAVTGAEATTAANEVARKLTTETATTLEQNIDKAIGRDIARSLVETGIPIGIATGIGYGMSAIEGGSTKDNVTNALLFGAMQGLGAIFHKKKGEKLTPDEVNKADGTVIRVPDEKGTPRDLLLLKDKNELTVTDVTGKVPPQAIQGVVLPKAPKPSPTDGETLTSSTEIDAQAKAEATNVKMDFDAKAEPTPEVPKPKVTAFKKGAPKPVQKGGDERVELFDIEEKPQGVEKPDVEDAPSASTDVRTTEVVENDVAVQASRSASLRRLKKIADFTTDEGKFANYDIDKDHRGRADMFVVLKDPNGYIVRNAFVPDAMQRSGLATELYQAMNTESLKKTGKPLRSTQPRTLVTGEVVHELTPDSIALWDSFVKKGVAEKLGEKDYRFLPIATKAKTPKAPKQDVSTSIDPKAKNVAEIKALRELGYTLPKQKNLTPEQKADIIAKGVRYQNPSPKKEQTREEAKRDYEAMVAKDLARQQPTATIETARSKAEAIAEFDYVAPSADLTAKQIAQMSQTDFDAMNDKQREANQIGRRKLVEKALADGKPVPAEVLADYPDLAKPTTPTYKKGDTVYTKNGVEGKVESVNGNDLGVAWSNAKVEGDIAETTADAVLAEKPKTAQPKTEKKTPFAKAEADILYQDNDGNYITQEKNGAYKIWKSGVTHATLAGTVNLRENGLEKAKQRLAQLTVSPKTETQPITKGTQVTYLGKTWTASADESNGRVMLKDAQGNGKVAKASNVKPTSDEPMMMVAGIRGVQNLPDAKVRQNNYIIAKSMDELGLDTKRIWLATGWEKGKDGKWRNEIDDSDVQLDTKGLSQEDGKLSEILQFPELYKAYPALGDVNVKFVALDRNTLGSFDAATNTIKLAKGRNAKSTLLHEVQHAIQKLEGFATGGNENVAAIQMAYRQHGFASQKEWEAAVSDLESQIAKLRQEKMPLDKVEARLDYFFGSPQKQWRVSIETPDGSVVTYAKTKKQGILDLEERWSPTSLFTALDELRRLTTVNAVDAFTAYQQLVGEVEARNVQLRHYMTPAERAKSALSETEDVPRDKQIVRDSDESMMQAVPQSQIDAVKEVRNADGKLVAPNGKPSNLNERQWREVRTPAFIKWFGDWINDPENASKAVDENGEPKIYHHGQVERNKEIEAFKPYVGASFFTSNIGMAESFAAGSSNLYKRAMGREYESGPIYPAFLNLRTPLEIDAQNDSYSDFPVPARFADEFIGETASTDEVADVISGSKTYDGAIITNVVEGTGQSGDVVIVPRSNQIKSSISNNGNYDAGEDSIMMQAAFQGTPHRFNKEILVEDGNGNPVYLEGTPDEMPTVPKEYKVIKEFPNGRIRSDKIGTGEGAQAYSYGHYFADAESVADHYKRELGDTVPVYDGEEIPSGLPFGGGTYREQALQMLGKATREGLTNPLGAVEQRLEYYRDNAEADNNQQSLKTIKGIREAFSELDPKKFTIKQTGSKYRVDLKPEQDDYLLWDKPLSEQSEKVQKALEAISQDADIADFHNARQTRRENRGLPRQDSILAKDLYETLAKRNSPKEASAYLLSLGIRGVKYLDGTSRSKGEGNYNYVIFDENDVSIEEVMRRAIGELDKMVESFRNAATLSNKELLSTVDFRKNARVAEDGVIAIDEIPEIELVRRLLNNARKELGQTENSTQFYGVFSDQNAMNALNKAIEGFVKNTSDAKTRKVLRDLQKLITQAAQGDGTVIFAMSEESVPEEKAHKALYGNREGNRASQIEKSIEDAIANSDVFKNATKFQQAYSQFSQAAKVEEFSVKASLGQWNDLGITTDADKFEAMRQARLFYRSYAVTNKGNLTLDKLLTKLSSEIAYAEEYKKYDEEYKNQEVQGNQKEDKVADEGGVVEPAGGSSDKADAKTSGESKPDGLNIRRYSESLRDAGFADSPLVPYIPGTDAQKAAETNRIIETSDPMMYDAENTFYAKGTDPKLKGVLGTALIDHLGSIGEIDRMLKVAKDTVEYIGTAAQVLQAAKLVAKYDFASGLMMAQKAATKAGRDLTPKEVDNIKTKLNKVAVTLENQATLEFVVQEMQDAIRAKDAELADIAEALTEANKVRKFDEQEIQRLKKQLEAKKPTTTREKLKESQSAREARIRAQFAQDATMMALPSKMSDALLADLIDEATVNILDGMTPDQMVRRLQDLTNNSLTDADIADIHLKAWDATGYKSKPTTLDELSVEDKQARLELRERAKARREHIRAINELKGEAKESKYVIEVREYGKANGYTDGEIAGALYIPQVTGSDAVEQWKQKIESEFGKTNFNRAYHLRKVANANIRAHDLEARRERAQYEGDAKAFNNDLARSRNATRAAKSEFDRYSKKVGRHWLKKGAVGVTEALAATKGLSTWGEISYILRQGFVPLLTDTRLASKADWQGVGHGLQGDNVLWSHLAEKAGFEDVAQYLSDHNVSMFIDRIRQHPLFADAQSHGVRFTQIGDFNIADDHFSVKALEVIPFYKRTELAYTLPGDLQRLYIYENWSQIIDGQGLDPIQTKKAKQYAAETVNAFTGKGDVKRILASDGAFAKLLNLAFFSPQLLISRFQSINRLTLGAITAPKGMKWQMAKKGMRFYGIIGLLAYLTGMILDPDDDEFGTVKVKVGDRDTRDVKLNYLAGLDVPAQLYMRTALGMGKSLVSGDGAYMGDAMQANINDFIVDKRQSPRFARSKLSPAASFGYDWLNTQQTDFIGRPTTLWSSVTSRVAPLSWQQTYDALLYDRYREMVKEPRDLQYAKDKWNTSDRKYANALITIVASFTGMGITQYPRDEQSQAMQLARQLSPAVSKKDAETLRQEGGLRSLLKAQSQTPDSPKIRAAIQDWVRKNPELYKKMETLRSQANSKTGLLGYYGKDLNADQLKRIREKATDPDEIKTIDEMIKRATKKK